MKKWKFIVLGRLWRCLICQRNPFKNKFKWTMFQFKFKKKHIFRYLAPEKVEGSLSYANSESEILFFKVSSNFVEKMNAIGQYLGGESFVWKKMLGAWMRQFVNVLRLTPRDVATERIFLMSFITRVFFILIILNFGKNFFIHVWTTFALEVFFTLNSPTYFLSAMLEKHELRRASVCYWISLNSRHPDDRLIYIVPNIGLRLLHR